MGGGEGGLRLGFGIRRFLGSALVFAPRTKQIFFVFWGIAAGLAPPQRFLAQVDPRAAAVPGRGWVSCGFVSSQVAVPDGSGSCLPQGTSAKF